MFGSGLFGNFGPGRPALSAQVERDGNPAPRVRLVRLEPLAKAWTRGSIEAGTVVTVSLLRASTSCLGRWKSQVPAGGVVFLSKFCSWARFLSFLLVLVCLVCSVAQLGCDGMPHSLSVPRAQALNTGLMPAAPTTLEGSRLEEPCAT